MSGIITSSSTRSGPPSRQARSRAVGPLVATLTRYSPRSASASTWMLAGVSSTMRMSGFSSAMEPVAESCAADPADGFERARVVEALDLVLQHLGQPPLAGRGELAADLGEQGVGHELV